MLGWRKKFYIHTENCVILKKISNQENKFLEEEKKISLEKTEKSKCKCSNVEYWHSNNKSPVSFLLMSPTWMILGVLWNVDIWIDSTWSFFGCGKIFDFGILRIIRFETCFLMIITREPINVMYMHITKRILSFLK